MAKLSAVRGFRSVSDTSTGWPFLLLTSEFGWDLVLWKEYGRQLTESTHIDGTKFGRNCPAFWSKREIKTLAPQGTEQHYKHINDNGMNLSRSPNKVGSHAYNTRTNLCSLHMMYRFHSLDIDSHRSDNLALKDIFCQKRVEAMKSFAVSISSDLEAFSLSWAGVSFAALIVQLAALPSTWTSCSSRTRLDYCCKTIISRIKLTCLATV